MVKEARYILNNNNEKIFMSFGKQTYLAPISYIHGEYLNVYINNTPPPQSNEMGKSR
jgi:hypothetical protein